MRMPQLTSIVTRDVRIGEGDVKLIAAAMLTFLVAAQAGAEPGAHWSSADPASMGWSAEKLKTVEEHAGISGTVAVMIVQDDRVIASWGNVAQKANVHSIRKSLLSTLYDAAVADGRINLSSTLASLGINDKPPVLTEEEKKATVRDLLMARSGVYHLAAEETEEMRELRPARGSHVHGTYWFYNNWDFNALGSIYRNATGEDIFASFANRIAGPIGMEDFGASDGRYVYDAASEHPAYIFRMSARDAARFGLLIRQSGRWGSQQVVSSRWVAQMTRAYSQTNRGSQGYGYLWWTLPPDIGGFFASGNGGQGIAVIPARRLVVVRTADPAGSDHGDKFVDLVRLVVAAQR
jgi:CubicO group peptidase (beta-lactamase class C family)